MLNCYTSKRIQVTLEPQPIGRGGEGNIYLIKNPNEFKSCVAKIYKKDSKKQYKISYIINTVPNSIINRDTVWPKESVFDKNGKFIGFIMPKAVEKGIKLNILCSSRVNTQKYGSEWEKFCREKREAILLRLKICANISLAVNNIHSEKSYVLVDLKPENILISPSGQISIIDIDSIGIYGGNKSYPAEVHTYDYTPPEFYKNKSLNDIQRTWDYFSMGVVFYMILAGIHPYTGTCKSPYDTCTSYDQKIMKGLYPHGSKGSFFVQLLPEQSVIKNYPSNIQELFTKCFNEGHDNPSIRPTPCQWYNEIIKLIEDIKSSKVIINVPQTFLKKPKIVPPPKPLRPKYKSPINPTPKIKSKPSSFVSTITHTKPKNKTRKVVVTLILLIFIISIIIGLFNKYYSTNKLNDTKIRDTRNTSIDEINNYSRNNNTNETPNTNTNTNTKDKNNYNIPEIESNDPSQISYNWIYYLKNKNTLKNAWKLLDKNLGGDYNKWEPGYINIEDTYIHRSKLIKSSNGYAEVEVIYDAHDKVYDSKNNKCNNCFVRYHRRFLLKFTNYEWKIYKMDNDYYSDWYTTFDLKRFGKL
jgi:hypothetical protein